MVRHKQDDSSDVVLQPLPRSGIRQIWDISCLSKRDIFSRALFLCIIVVFLWTSIVCIVHAAKWIDKPFAGFLVNQRMVVVGYSGSHYWTGRQAGIKYPDKILKANDKAIATVRELEEVIRNTNIGEPVKYSIIRNDQNIEVSVPTMHFMWRDLINVFGFSFIIGSICFLMAVVVFIMKPGMGVSWVFLLAGFFLSISRVISFDIVSPDTGFIRIYLLVNTIVPATITHLSLLFPEKSRLIERYPLIKMIPYVISLVLVVPLELFYPGPLFVTLYKFVLMYSLSSVVLLMASITWTFFKTSSVIGRQRAKVVLFGAALAFPLPASAPLVSFLGKNLSSMLYVSVEMSLMVFPASIAYAIAKHNLFDVDVYIKRAVGYVIMTAIVGMTYFAMQTLVSSVILQPVLGEKAENVNAILFAVLVVFFFNPFNRVIQGWVDKLFYRKKFDYKATVTSVSQALTSLLSLDEVIRQVIHTVRKEMFIDTAGVVLLDLKNRSCQTLFIGNSDNHPDNVKDQIKDVSIKDDDPLLALLSKEKKLITRYDIAEDPKYFDIRESCGQRFTEMRASLAIPMIHKDEVKGVLVLGHKKSGHFYTREDIDLLTTLTSQGAVAIENARLFEENLEKGRMEEELKIAHDIQVSMLPEKSPEIEGFEIVGKSIPAKEVGGDFYDFIEIDSGEGSRKLGIIVGDVTGKGVSGALMMAASRSTYRVLAEQYSSVEELMGVGNRRLNKDIKKGMFVALLYAELTPQERTLILSNAGQTQPVLCPADRSKQPCYIDTEGDKFPLGIIKDCNYQKTEVRLKSGDAVVFYTDGVVEALNDKGELYGFERFLSSIEDGRGLSANTLLEKLMNDISHYVGGVEQHDDLTIVVVKVQ